jgi:hypothetical protein
MLWHVIVLLIMGVTACGGSPYTTTSKPIPCQPESGNANLYRSTPHPWINLIYTYSGIAVPIEPNSIPAMIPVTGDHSQQAIAARHAALQLLIKETERWSNTATIKLDNSSEAHIVVTFIHPELVQAIYLNEILQNSHMVPDINEQMNEVMNRVSQRDELLFMVTVLTNHRDPLNITHHILDIPIGEMELTNAEDISVPPLHDDHNLDQPIDTGQKPVFGFLGYPIGIETNGGCIWVLDTTYNTNIVIVVDSILIDGAKGGPYAWTIRYQSLIDTGIPIGSPDFAIPSYDLSLLSPLAAPPSEINDPDFLRDFSRFIWRQVTFGN